jgi:RimJ/RimL family protein N-acetyltransferase
MKAKCLQSNRLLYEPLSLSHLSERYVGWLNDSEINMFLESRNGYTIEMLSDYLKNQENRNILFWAIIEKETGEHIGNIKIDPINTENNSGEYGILIGEKKKWGKGFAKEASYTIIRYCFEKLNLSRITLGVISKNVPAIRLYEKLGFKKVSIKKNVGIYNGFECNSLRMEICNE